MTESVAMHDENGVIVSFNSETNLFTVVVNRTYTMELEPRPFKDDAEMTESLEEISYEAAEALDEYVEDVAESLGAVEDTETGFLPDES